MSEGIVSSLAGKVASNATTMTGLIESNALTEPAVAGGALLDAEGRVAGILMTPVERSSGDRRGADPIRQPRRRRAARRRPRRPRLARPRGKASATGRWSSPLWPPADRRQKAGIEVGDIVVNADSQPIATMDDLMAAARGTGPATASSST